MAVCTFFGHRDCPASLRPQLYSAVVERLPGLKSQLTTLLEDDHTSENIKNKHGQSLLGGHPCLFDFLLQIVKQIAVKKLPYADVQAVTQLLERNHTGILAFFVQHTVNSRWRNTRHTGQCVDCHISLRTQVKNAFCNRFFCVHLRIPPRDVS